VRDQVEVRAAVGEALVEPGSDQAEDVEAAGLADVVVEVGENVWRTDVSPVVM
jgi:hypothetical protein